MRCFRHNPYDLQHVIVADTHFDQARTPSPGPQYNHTEPNTLHAELFDHVNFFPYPDSFTMQHCSHRKEDMQRLFIGQLPYNVTTMQVAWIIEFATGRPVFFTECIKRWTQGQQPKGCVHTYCYPADEAHIMSVLHRRVLVDDTGIWFAEDALQHEALESYCAAMKKDKRRRFRDRPYQPLVAQLATSTFVPYQHSATRRGSPAPEDIVEEHQAPPQYAVFLAQNVATVSPPRDDMDE